MKIKKSIAILKILEDLKKGKIICTQQYANYLGVDIRSVQRYLEEISNFYDIEFIKPQRGCYSFPQISKIKEKIIDAKESEDFEKFTDILALLNKEVLDFLDIDKNVIKKIISEDIFKIKENPVEKFLNIDIYKRIKRAIKHRKILDILYIPDEKYEFKNVKPLKIIFAEGNWYLAALSDDNINNGFKFLRINFIKEIKEYSKTFKPVKEAEEFLENFQSLFSRYKVKPFEVILEIDNEVKRYFKVKKFLPSQTIIDENDKFLTVKYYVTSEEEILRLVKKWIPFIKIKSPEFLKDKLRKDLKNYLDNF